MTGTGVDELFFLAFMPFLPTGPTPHNSGSTAAIVVTRFQTLGDIENHNMSYVAPGAIPLGSVTVDCRRKDR